MCLVFPPCFIIVYRVLGYRCSPVLFAYSYLPTGLNLGVLALGKLAPFPDSWAGAIEDEWDRNQSGADAAEDCERPLDAHVPIEWNANDCHYTGRGVTRDGHECQC